ncbi:MAG: oligosaccharide flippase family protein, partial [Geminicoccaceae bacterium]
MSDADNPRTPTTTPLGRRIARAAAFLTGRMVLSSTIGVVSVVLITREIGPAAYGLFVSIQAIMIYLGILAGLGVNVYLIRSEEEPDRDAYHQAFTLVIVSSVLLSALGLAFMPLLEAWLSQEALTAPYLAMLLTLPLFCLTQPPLALMERSLNYRSVAAVELSSQVLFALVAITLAYRGAGFWAPIIGHIARQGTACILACLLAGVWPKLRWSRSQAAEMTRYGLGFSGSEWILEMRRLVNPLVVGGALGLEAVAVVNLANRIVEVLAFIREAATRLAIVAMAKVQQDQERSRRMLDEAMVVQTILLGPALAGFASIGPWLVPLVYGSEWDGIFIVYSWIALGALINAIFNMHASQLYLRRRNADVALFHLAHVLLLAGTVFVMVREFGLIGYGLGELAALVSYALLHWRVLAFVEPSYGRVVPWL